MAGYARRLKRLGAEPLPITDDHALLAGRVDWDHRDPFDRMLAAQAMTESLTLVTKDAAFTSLPGIRTLWWGMLLPTLRRPAGDDQDPESPRRLRY